MRQPNHIDLFYNDEKLQSYLDNALIPMVQGLSDHPALAAWEVINEPEGATQLGQTDPDPCFDLTHLDNVIRDGENPPGWTGALDQPHEVCQLGRLGSSQH